MNPVKKSIKRKAAAKKIIRRRMLYAAGLGLVPIPIIDAAGILTTQILMIKDIAKIYRVPFKEQRVKSLIGALVGSLATAGMLKAIPGLGTLAGGLSMSLTGVAATYALGKIFTLHFEQGGTLLDFDPVKSRKYFEQAYKEGEIRAATLQESEKSRWEKLFQSNKTSSKTTSTVSQKLANNGQKLDYASTSAAFQAKLKKAKRRKALQAKHRRKAIFKRIVSRLILFLLFVGFLAWFYTKYVSHRFGAEKDAIASNELELFLRENQAKKINLEPVETLDSLTEARIASFSPISTEGVIAQYIQSPDAMYPKRYALNAVRFMGSSDALSSGAKGQLDNIAILIKKYPDLLVNIYGHTSSKGPIFNRQRIGRERARVLKDVFVNQGIPAYRITGNYIEKQESPHDGYWGAEIVVHAATVNNVVEVAPPSFETKSKNIFSNLIAPPKEEEIPEKPTTEEQPTESPTKKTVARDNTPSSTAKPEKKGFFNKLFKKEPEEEQATEPPEEEIISDSLQTPATDIEEKSIQEDNNIPKETRPTKEDAPPSSKPKVVTTEGLIEYYINQSNPTYPKAFGFKDLLFEGETTNIDNRGITQLKSIARLMEKYPQLRITINAYVAGKAPHNPPAAKEQFLLKWQQIGQKRAQAIKKILRQEGIPNRQIKTGFKFQNAEAENKFWRTEIIVESN